VRAVAIPYDLLRNGLAVLSGAFLLMIPAWWNGYPLLYPDVGTYLWSGFQRELLIGRPMAYGLFLVFASGGRTLWFALFAQCLIISWVLYRFLPLFNMKDTQRPPLHLLILLVLSCCTGFALNSAQLLPDAFTPLIFLLLAMVLFKDQRWPEWFTNGVLLVFVITTHNSHGMIALITLLGLIVVKLISRAGAVRWSRIAVAGALVCAALLAIPLLHSFVGGTFALSRGEHVFLLNRTREAGVLQAYLRGHCAEKDYALCAYQDLLEGDFMWDMDRSPLYKLGGWDETEGEFNRILGDMLSKPEYMYPLAADVVKSWFRQMVTWDFEDMGQMGMNSGPYHPIHTYLPLDETGMVYALQGQETLSFPVLHKIARVAVTAALAGMILLLLYRKTPVQHRLMLALLLVFLVANAIVCATFSLAIGRYGARVIWLCVFMMAGLAFSRSGVILDKGRPEQEPR